MGSGFLRGKGADAVLGLSPPCQEDGDGEGGAGRSSFISTPPLRALRVPPAYCPQTRSGGLSRCPQRQVTCWGTSAVLSHRQGAKGGCQQLLWKPWSTLWGRLPGSWLLVWHLKSCRIFREPSFLGSAASCPYSDPGVSSPHGHRTQFAFLMQIWTRNSVPDFS